MQESRRILPAATSLSDRTNFDLRKPRHAGRGAITAGRVGR